VSSDVAEHSELLHYVPDIFLPLDMWQDFLDVVGPQFQLSFFLARSHNLSQVYDSTNLHPNPSRSFCKFTTTGCWHKNVTRRRNTHPHSFVTSELKPGFDVHDYARRMELAVQRLKENKKVSLHNRLKIFRFLDYLETQQVSLPRRVSLYSSFRRIWNGRFRIPVVLFLLGFIDNC